VTKKGKGRRRGVLSPAGIFLPDVPDRLSLGETTALRL
jgi:hypothetical protein